MSPFKLTSSRLILLIFIVLGIVTIAGTFISNFGMWSNYDRIEAEQGIAPADAEPLPKPLPGQEVPAQ